MRSTLVDSLLSKFTNPKRVHNLILVLLLFFYVYVFQETFESTYYYLFYGTCELPGVFRYMPRSCADIALAFAVVMIGIISLFLIMRCSKAGFVLFNAYHIYMIPFVVACIYDRYTLLSSWAEITFIILLLTEIVFLNYKSKQLMSIRNMNQAYLQSGLLAIAIMIFCGFIYAAHS
jgi:hypothetical protein